MKMNFLMFLALCCIFLAAFGANIALEPVPPECPQKIGPPCPRYYDNPYEDYKPGDSTILPAAVRQSIEKLQNSYIDEVIAYASPQVDAAGWSVMAGSAGRAMTFLRVYANTKNETVLGWARQYIDYSLSHMSVTPTEDVSFLYSSNGVYCLASVIYDLQGDKEQSKQFVQEILTGFKNAHLTSYNDIDSGRAGLIMIGNYLNNYFKQEVIPASLIVNVAEQVLSHAVVDPIDGHLSWKNAEFNQYFWGQGMGSTGIITQLLDVPGIVSNTTYAKQISDTMNYYVKLQLPSGNFPTPLVSPYPLKPDILVQWCHGSPGFIPVLVKAWQTFKNDSWLATARKAADNLWEKGLLTKGLMLGHGISGNTYMQLYIHRATGDDKFLYRAIKFQQFVVENPIVSDPTLMRKPTPTPYMGFAGSYCGAIVLWSDMLVGNDYHMPGFEPHI